MYYIYLTTNLVNNKQYIGQHKGSIHDSYLGSGRDIVKAIKKYGSENFKKEILIECDSREEADYWESYYINYYNAVEDKNFYNLQEGGTGGDGWRACHRWFLNHPEEAQQIYKKNGERLRQWRVDHQEEFYNKVIIPLIDESKRWRESHPEEVKEIMKKVNQAKIEWQNNNKEKHEQQVKDWIKSGSVANSQEILCITTGEVFESQSAAARYYNIPQSNISKCLSGERKSA